MPQTKCAVKDALDCLEKLNEVYVQVKNLVISCNLDVAVTMEAIRIKEVELARLAATENCECEDLERIDHAQRAFKPNTKFQDDGTDAGKLSAAVSYLLGNLTR